MFLGGQNALTARATDEATLGCQRRGGHGNVLFDGGIACITLQATRGVGGYSREGGALFMITGVGKDIRGLVVPVTATDCV